MKKICSIIILLLLIFTCAHRDNPIYPRNNPWDAASENYSFNSNPVVSARHDSLWYDFDHNKGSGAIRLLYSVSDQNLPNDTLQTRIFVINTEGNQREVFAVNDSVCIIDGLFPAATYRCSLAVIDRWDSAGTFVDTIRTPLLIPPLPPHPWITPASNSITLTWNRVENAGGYSVYRADRKNGVYELISSVDQPSAGICSIMYPFDKPVSFYYIVASKNSSGECRSRDTLHGTVLSDKVAVPVIDSVSKGTYSDFIKINWHVKSNSIAEFDIYRSASDTSFFRLIASVRYSEGSNSYFDSVTTSEIYYYKIAAVDTQGYSSRFSATDYGFLTMNTLSIRLTVTSNSNFIGLNWDPVGGAKSYVVFRSKSSCTGEKEKITTTSLLSYNDTVASTATFYYSVSAYDKDSREIAKSNCESASLGLLPAPKGIKVTSSNNPVSITLSWDPLSGADSFIIFRTVGECPTDENRFAATKNNRFTDTSINTSSTYYYRIAAVDRGGRTGILSNCYPASIQLLSSPQEVVISYGIYADYILLKWSKLAGAASYNIYRSKSCGDNMAKIKSVTDTFYIDSVPTTDIYYYVIAGVDNGGKEGSPSACTPGRVKLLPAPANLYASNGTFTKGIQLSWSPVTGATGYIIYRGSSSATNSAIAIDTVTSTGYFDSVTTTFILYYWVAALNRLGVHTRSNYVYGSILTSPVLTIQSRSNDGLILSWKTNGTEAITYIYRSKDSTRLIRIDSTKNNTYNDYPPDYDGYYYRIDLRTPSGEIVSSNTVLGYKLLPTPEGLKATEAVNGVLLQWKPVRGATGYIIYRSESSSESIEYKQVTDTFYFDNLTTTTRYYYRVAAYNPVQRSSLSTYVIAGKLQVPARPEIRSVTGTSNAIIIEWYMPSGSPEPSGYYISRARKSTDTIIIGSTTFQQYVDSVNDTGYFYYRIAAYNEAGTGPWSSAWSGRLQPPSPPTIISISLASYSKYVRIVWERIKDANQYSIYRSTFRTSGFEKIGTTTDTVFFDTTAVPNTRYFYRLASIRASIEGEMGNSFSGMRLGPPEYVNAISSMDGVQLEWYASTTLYSVRMYYIYRSTSPDGPFVKIDSVAGTTSYNYYLDTNENIGDNYYKISASNLDETPLSVSSEAAHRNFPYPPFYLYASEGTDSAVVAVFWEDAYGAQGYRIYRCTSDSFLTGVFLVGTTDTTVFFDTVPSDSFYYYRVKSFNRAGESSLSESFARGYRIPRSIPSAPLDLDTLGSEPSSVVLAWKMPSRTIVYNGFKIYRADSLDGTYSLVKIADASQDYYGTYYFYDKPPYSFPTVYWYKVTAYNAKGESEPSNIVSATRR